MKSFLIKKKPDGFHLQFMENDLVVEKLKDGSLKFDVAVGDTYKEFRKLCYLYSIDDMEDLYYQFIDEEITEITLQLKR